MKTFYENPEMEIVKFAVEDVITTSGLTDGGAGDGDSEDFGDLM